MKCNSELSKSEWGIKESLDRHFNSIFFSNKFRDYIVAECGYCPSGLTIDTRFENDGSPVLVCCTKKYGYEHTHNNGMNGDIGDYEATPITNEKYRDCCMTFVNDNDENFCNKLIAEGYSVAY